MKREVKFSLVFRDMWQSAGKYVPRVDQLVKVAPAIIEMGCFARVETNGGGFEQVNLLFGENPNRAVREWTKPFHEAGIQTHMLDRALNGLRMSPVPADVRKLFYKVKKAQGTDITRTFCGLNDVRNIAPSITYAKEAGMISQCSLCVAHSPVRTVEYYTNMALELIKLGADEICIKDMAGIGRPVSLGKIEANFKAAQLSGINTDRTRIGAFVVTGLLAAVGGIFSVARLQSTTVLLGSSFNFDPIAAAVIGGCALDGGDGDIIGTFLGAIFMAALDNGILKLQLNTAYQYVIKGIIIILVVIFDAWYRGFMQNRAQKKKAEKEAAV